jgi:hypothetical protein
VLCFPVANKTWLLQNKGFQKQTLISLFLIQDVYPKVSSNIKEVHIYIGKPSSGNFLSSTFFSLLLLKLDEEIYNNDVCVGLNFEEIEQDRIASLS